MPDTPLQFGPFVLRPGRGSLTRQGVAVPLGARAMSILHLLARSAPRTVSNADILATVWPNLHVEEANIRVHVSALRRALGQGHAIVNRPGEGYSLATPVVPASQDDDALPAPAVPLIGRESDLVRLDRMLAEHRLVTLVGAGGIGKTSLAVAAAARWIGAASAGPAFVDLAPLIDPALVADAVARALGVSMTQAAPVQALVDALRERPRLLVLDNCEHLSGSVADLAEQLLTEAREVRILATSREPLRIAGEALHRLRPLELPVAGLPDATARDTPALRLLLDRAAANDPPFEPAPEEIGDLARLCSALDGLPLAIELVAAHLGPHSAAEVLVNLGEHLARPRPLPDQRQPRHRSLQAAIDWSFELLRPAERSLLLRLGVFRAHMSLESIVAVAGAGDGVDVDASAQDGAPLPPPLARESLAELVDRSLVAVTLDGAAPTYRLLDTMRDYASRRLRETVWEDDVRRCHLQRVHQRLDRLRTAGPAEYAQAWRDSLLDDLRAALDWAFSPGGDPALGVRLTAAAGQFFMQTSMVAEFRRHAERALVALAATPDAAAEMQLLGTLGMALFHAEGPGTAILATHERALELAGQLGDLAARRRSLWGIWLYHFGQGQYAEGLSFAAAYRACTPAEDDPLHVADRCTAMSLTYLGRLAEARVYMDRVLARPAQPQERVVGQFQFEPRVATRALLARTLWLQGLADQARAAAEQSLEEALAGGHALSICFSLVIGRCFVAQMTGDAATLKDGIARLLATARLYALPRWEGHGLILAEASAFEGRRGHIDLDDAMKGGAAHREALAWLGLRLPPDDEILLPAPIWATPEMLRLAALRGPSDRAPGLLDRADALARDQGALAWRLRIALTRRRLARDAGERADAARALDAVLPCFTEGFDTPDLIDALHRP
ncbi:ATP-binding protein [Roseomonas fluvialis]|uniref:ATPase n=1 Tax=Roseomonas fluvialis TaxID=1750527 RepID=A0ABN6P9L3_9PROT|nr:winged helix-turn-helix domain-containing protein [Roseomonas fluvialis]BDG74351.1 ATPase [Roseomonas fluvialis]